MVYYKEPTKLKKYLGKEVFIVANDGDAEIGDVNVFKTLDQLNEHLSLLNPIAESNVTVVHGIIMAANYIPDDIGDSVYVLAMDSQDADTGAIFEMNEGDPGKLAEVIERLLNGNSYSAANELEGLSIDNIFIIYGYELTLCYAIAEEEVDEQVLERCKRIANGENDKTTGETER